MLGRSDASQNVLNIWFPNTAANYTKSVYIYIKLKVKVVCGSYSTAALRHIVLLPK